MAVLPFPAQRLPAVRHLGPVRGRLVAGKDPDEEDDEAEDDERARKERRAGGGRVAPALAEEKRTIGNDCSEDRHGEPGPAGIDALDRELRVAIKVDLTG